MANERIAIPGSERDQIPNSNVIGTPDPNKTISVTVVLRRRTENLPPSHEHISRAHFAERFGADPADALRVEQFAADNDLTVVQTDLARRSVVLTGTVANMSEAFGTQLSIFQTPEGAFRGRTGQLSVPADLAASIVGVFGLDERPQARAHKRRLTGATPEAVSTSYTPPAVAKLYGYPTTVTGSGQTIGLIELGGGYRSADLQTYFKNLGLKSAPTVTSVSVDGGKNAPVGSVDSADGEVLLDIEVTGSIAYQANIAVYFAPNTDQGFLDAITTAIHDSLRKPSVISISWGGPESTWTGQSLTAFDQAFQDAGLLGVTVCVASGDSGSSDGVTDGLAHVDFPASSPNVLACGGTSLKSSQGKISTETAWNDSSGATGGGVSETFPLPSYQANAKVPVSVNPSKFKGRGVPDVSGDADPSTGYQVRVDGRSAVFGGTSAVAPLWAALIALLNQEHGSPRGFWNPSLYAAPAGSFHDITSGNNGGYSCRAGWDACTGLGSPNGQALTSLKSKKAGA